MDTYQPQEDSHLLQKEVKKHAFGTVLDLGTGSGIQAIIAAQKESVKKVYAADIDKNAIEECKKTIKNKKITFLVSDLFSVFDKTKGKKMEIKEARFDTIIFNPPYLPQERHEPSDSALQTTGGKHGYELLGRFLNQVNAYLKPNGMALIVFSSLTSKTKIDQFIEDNLLEKQQLAEMPLFFETLYCYRIRKSQILKELEKGGITGIKKFARGKRGVVSVGLLQKRGRRIKVAIKIKRKESKARGRLQNEARWLKILNRKGIGPKLLFAGNDYLVYQFAEGMYLPEWIKREKNVKKIRKIIKNIFMQCFMLDQLGVNKKEMHRPLKHVLVDYPRITMIDFERTHKAKKPKNVTQFGQFVMQNNAIKEKLRLDQASFVEKIKAYKKLRKKGLLDELIWAYIFISAIVLGYHASKNY